MKSGIGWSSWGRKGVVLQRHHRLCHGPPLRAGPHVPQQTPLPPRRSGRNSSEGTVRLERDETRSAIFELSTTLCLGLGVFASKCPPSSMTTSTYQDQDNQSLSKFNMHKISALLAFLIIALTLPGLGQDTTTTSDQSTETTPIGQQAEQTHPGRNRSATKGGRRGCRGAMLCVWRRYCTDDWHLRSRHRIEHSSLDLGSSRRQKQRNGQLCSVDVLSDGHGNHWPHHLFVQSPTRPT